MAKEYEILRSGIDKNDGHIEIDNVDAFLNGGMFMYSDYINNDVDMFAHDKLRSTIEIPSYNVNGKVIIDDRVDKERMIKALGFKDMYTLHMLTPTKIIRQNSNKNNKISTVVFWNDGTKTIVRLCQNDNDDVETAFAYALMKRVFGSHHGIQKMIEKITTEKGA